jgi:hypothetical protein
MVDTLYFSGYITGDGEIKLIRVERHIDSAFPSRVDPTSLVPNTKSDPLNNDPTLAQFHCPQSKHENRSCCDCTSEDK